ncbi:MAG: nucleoid occlusion factor SlmA [Pseudomonadales bacterium]|jgi:TetR/AcrR family transcriptional regulator|nr:nucleoid occlusion factor SlmA [Pseudomonadales bacterium]MDP6469435.1 nucleoid occlusion factor SlmA [Pseudomonadales bacterium]MDP6827277.1 nucleoid occlusion factor SlmA [Pseudomonadales bacterium]MDP6971100.1 nucleoid occlusion factor SlmA [Pseudomonadales bacterium]|tara:strand:- start:993 stop:1574 length:582 start_codon:yes stop_codon:yes gene_type:complete
MPGKPNRRQEILEAFVYMLETQPGERITTARLAREVGVSEAALYRHFPSKAKMIEALIAFAEESLFPRVNLILSESAAPRDRCRQILRVLLTFAERNPGFARLLTGDALLGENDHLRGRIRQLFDRLETQLRQVLREDPDRVASARLTAGVAANLLAAYAEGRITQFVRSEFRTAPTAAFDDQWGALEIAVFS